MAEFNVYEGIMEGLREALACQQGDRKHCRVTVRELPKAKNKTADDARTQKS